MNHASRLVVRALVATILVGSAAACVSPAARVPSDGRLEPINLPTKKAEAPIKRPDVRASKESP
jgi:hypothetical protein